MSTEIVTPRIPPLEPPFSPDVGAQLEKMMPRGVPPIALFRTFARNLAMTEAMGGWGSYELGRRLSLSMREREIVIIRTCARCRCEYEWGVHLEFFSERAGFDTEQVASLTAGTPNDPCWLSVRDRLLIRATDALHEAADIEDGLWAELTDAFTDASLLDLLLLCGWYHTISFAARAARVPLEPGAPRFSSIGAGLGVA